MYNSNPPLIDAYGRSLRAAQLKYTPVVVHFRPSALSPDGSPLQVASEYFLRVHPPAVVHRGVQTTIPEPFVVEVPADGVVRLQLASSSAEHPIGHYVVDYFRRGARNPLMTQHWVVPEFSGNFDASHDFVYTGQDPFELPLNVWLVRSVSWNSIHPNPPVWSAHHNLLTWPSQTSPVVGESIRVVFQPALTLADIVDQDLTLGVANNLSRRRA